MNYLERKQNKSMEQVTRHEIADFLFWEVMPEETTKDDALTLKEEINAAGSMLISALEMVVIDYATK